MSNIIEIGYRGLLFDNFLFSNKNLVKRTKLLL